MESEEMRHGIARLQVATTQTYEVSLFLCAQQVLI